MLTESPRTMPRIGEDPRVGRPVSLHGKSVHTPGVRLKPVAIETDPEDVIFRAPP